MSDQSIEARLAQQPFDPELLGVYADWLLERGDVRGEFIALQLSILRDPRKPASLTSKEADFLQAHPELVPPGLNAKLQGWLGGFIEHLHLEQQHVADPELSLMHPSLAYVRAIHLHHIRHAWRARLTLPVAHTLSIAGGDGSVDTLIATLPHLERLDLLGADWLIPRHSGVRELTLATTPSLHSEGVLERLEAKSMPALMALTVKGLRNTRRLRYALNVLEKLEDLTIVKPNNPDGVYKVLVQHASRRRLRTITLDGGFASADLAALQSACDSLVVGSKRESAWHVRHLRKAEWGVGRVEQVLGERAAIVFEDGKSRTLLMDGRYLRTVPAADVASDAEQSKESTTMDAPVGHLEGVDSSRLARAFVVGVSKEITRLCRKKVITGQESRAFRRNATAMGLDLAVVTGGSKAGFRRTDADDGRVVLGQTTVPQLVAVIAARAANRRDSNPRGAVLLTVRDDTEAGVVLRRVHDYFRSDMDKPDMDNFLATFHEAFVASRHA